MTKIAIYGRVSRSDGVQEVANQLDELHAWAARLGGEVVAEFVDRAEVLAKLREIGIDYAQGFLLHRPEPLQHLLREARPLDHLHTRLPE